MPPELSPARRRSRKLWRRIRSVAALLPPIGFQWLRHLLWHGSTLPISHPRTLTHHLFLKMARDRNPLLTVTSDKLAVRGYVAERLGPGYLPELYGVVDWPEQLLDLDLPPRYVVKATHGSGMTAVVTRDSAAERASVAARARKWLASRYWRKNGEWGYRGIQPRLIIEEFLDAGGGGFRPTGSGSASAGAPRWCRWTSTGSPGTPATSTIPTGRPVAPPAVLSAGARDPAPLVLPANARGGGEHWRTGFDFVRVDLYALGDRIVVGELTHYPAGGNKSFDPPEWDARLGALWPRRRRR